MARGSRGEANSTVMPDGECTQGPQPCLHHRRPGCNKTLCIVHLQSHVVWEHKEEPKLPHALCSCTLKAVCASLAVLAGPLRQSSPC